MLSPSRTYVKPIPDLLRDPGALGWGGYPQARSVSTVRVDPCRHAEEMRSAFSSAVKQAPYLTTIAENSGSTAREINPEARRGRDVKQG